MRFIRYFLVLIACLASAFGSAVELGEMTFESRFSDPFNAKIQVANVQNISAQNLHVRVAPQIIWDSLGIDRSNYVDDIEMYVEVDGEGSAFIFINSTRRLAEPYLDLLVELQWPSGTMVKYYVALIPMGFESQIGANQTETSEVSNTDASTQFNNASQFSDTSSGESINTQISLEPEYGRIYITKNNETLESIAEQLEDSEFSVSELADVLFTHNFYVASRAQAIPAEVSIEIPERSVFQANTDPVISYAENSVFTDQTAINQVAIDESIQLTEGSNQDVSSITEVETSIAIFTPTERAEARIRALGFADVQSRLAGETSNQVVTAAGLKTVLDRLVAEQEVPGSIESSLEIFELAEGVRRIDESISEYRSRLSEVEFRTEVNGRSLESLGVPSGVVANSGGRIFWPIFGISLAVLLGLCLAFIWVLFRRPEYLEQSGVALPLVFNQYFRSNQAEAENKPEAEVENKAEEPVSEKQYPKPEVEKQEPVLLAVNVSEQTNEVDKLKLEDDVEVPMEDIALDLGNEAIKTESEPGSIEEPVETVKESSKSIEESIMQFDSSPDNLNADIQGQDQGKQEPQDEQEGAAESFNSDESNDAPLDFVLDNTVLKKIATDSEARKEPEHIVNQNSADLRLVDKTDGRRYEEFNNAKKRKEDNSSEGLLSKDESNKGTISEGSASSGNTDKAAKNVPKASQNGGKEISVHFLPDTDDLSTFTKARPMQVLSSIDNKVDSLSSSSQDLVLFYLGIEDFEVFERKLGIAAAEKLSLAVLQEIWNYVSSQKSPAILLNRFRQKSFVLMMPNMKDNEALEYALSLVEDIQARPIEVNKETRFVGISSAVIPIDETFESGSDAVSTAQNLVQQGQNTEDVGPKLNVRLYEPNLSKNMRDEALASVGRRLFEKGVFTPVYIPIIGLKTELTDMYLFESNFKLGNAIVEGNYPDDLLERLYSSSLSLELDAYLLSCSCKQLDAGSQDIKKAKVILNFSINTLTMNDFMSWFLDIVEDFNISPANFIIQIDENSASKQVIKLSKLKERMSQIGVEMSMSRVCLEHIPLKSIESLQFNYLKLHPDISKQMQNSKNKKVDVAAREKAAGILEEIMTCAKDTPTQIIVPNVEQAKFLPTLWQFGVNFIEGSYIAAESDNIHPTKPFLSDKPLV